MDRREFARQSVGFAMSVGLPAGAIPSPITWRLAGIHEDQETIQWNVRPGHPASRDASFRLVTDNGMVGDMRYERSGASLSFNRTLICRIEGGTARLVTDKSGKPLHLVGIGERQEHLLLRFRDRLLRMDPGPNELLPL